MKKLIVKSFPFIILAVLPVLSIFISGAAVFVKYGKLGPPKKRYYLNWTDNDSGLDGKLYIKTYMQKVYNLYLGDMYNKNNKRLIPEDLWEYNYETSELIIKTEIKPNEMIYFDSLRDTPRRVILLDYDTDRRFYYVIIGNRIAIEGKDYWIDEEKKQIIFSYSINFNENKFAVCYYRKNFGIYCYGNLPRSDDIYYLRSLENAKLWNKSDIKFKLIRGYKDELKIIEEQWEKNPIDLVTISKERSSKSDYEISREAGYNVNTPDIIFKKYKQRWKMIFSTSAGEFAAKYYVDLNDNKDRLKILTAKVKLDKKSSIDEYYCIDQDLILEKTELNILKVKVERLFFYSLDSSIKFGDFKPQIIKFDSYQWYDKDVKMRIDFKFIDESKREEHEKYIYEIIKYRKNAFRR